MGRTLQLGPVSCTSEQTDLQGNDLVQLTATSALHCQALCQSNADCCFFSWDNSGDAGELTNCWLKSSQTGAEDQSDRDSGPKYCDVTTCPGGAGTSWAEVSSQ